MYLCTFSVVEKFVYALVIPASILVRIPVSKFSKFLIAFFIVAESLVSPVIKVESSMVPSFSPADVSKLEKPTIPIFALAFLEYILSPILF